MSSPFLEFLKKVFARGRKQKGRTSGVRCPRCTNDNTRMRRAGLAPAVIVNNFAATHEAVGGDVLDAPQSAINFAAMLGGLRVLVIFKVPWHFEKLSAAWRLNTAICFAKPPHLPRPRICDPQAGSRPRNPAQENKKAPRCGLRGLAIFKVPWHFEKLSAP